MLCHRVRCTVSRTPGAPATSRTPTLSDDMAAAVPHCTARHLCRSAQRTVLRCKSRIGRCVPWRCGMRCRKCVTTGGTASRRAASLSIARHGMCVACLLIWLICLNVYLLTYVICTCHVYLFRGVRMARGRAGSVRFGALGRNLATARAVRPGAAAGRFKSTSAAAGYL